MRAISLVILIDDCLPIQEVVSKLECHFPEYHPEYTVLSHPISGNMAIHWRKIVIGDNKNMNEVVANIRDDIQNCRVIFEECGTEAGFFKKYKSYIIAVITVVLTTLVNYFFL